MAQIGPTWLGAESPVPPTPGQSTDGSSEDPVLPWEPSLVSGLVRHGKGLFTTVRKEKEAPEPADEPADEPLPEDEEDGYDPDAEDSPADETVLDDAAPVNADTMRSRPFTAPKLATLAYIPNSLLNELEENDAATAST